VFADKRVWARASMLLLLLLRRRRRLQLEAAELQMPLHAPVQVRGANSFPKQN